MKKSVLAVLICFSVLFGLWGCSSSSSGGGGSNPPTDLSELNVSISGTFDSNKNFTASSVSNPSSYALTSEGSRLYADLEGEYLLEGKLDDGDITFRLRGAYNSATQTYVLSAASSIIMYQISGNVDDAGTVTNNQATVKTKSGDSWVTTGPFPVTLGNVSVTGSVDADSLDGLPSRWHGIWFEKYDGMELYYMITPFTVSAFYRDSETGGQWMPDMPAPIRNIVTITANPDGSYDVITSNDGYVYNNGDWNTQRNLYQKYNVKESSSNRVVLRSYGVAAGDDYQDAFTTIAGIPTTLIPGDAFVLTR